LATPFNDAGNECVRAAYEGRGFTVVSAVGLACSDFSTIAQTSRDDIARLFREADHAEAEALVQVGTGLPVLAMIDGLEAELGKPVVASNQASYWQALRELGVADSIACCGRLLADY
jgi:maleate isomerase